MRSQILGTWAENTSDIAEKRVEHNNKDILQMERDKRNAYKQRQAFEELAR